MGDAPEKDSARPLEFSGDAKAETRRWMDRWKLVGEILEDERSRRGMEQEQTQNARSDGRVSAAEAIGAAGGLMDLATRLQMGFPDRDPVLQQDKQAARDIWALVRRRWSSFPR